MTGKTNESALWRRIIVLVALPLLALASSARSDPVFMGLGALQDAGWSRAWAISSDGTVVVGAATLGFHDEAFRWSAETGMVALPGVASLPGASFAYDISADGYVIVGGAYDRGLGAYRWTDEGGAVALSDATTRFIARSSMAISGDGATVVGKGVFDSGQSSAILWSEPTGLVNLGTLTGYTWSDASDVSADGSVVVGSSIAETGGQQAVLWPAGGEAFSLGTLPDQDRSSAEIVSPSGDLIVGISGSEAFAWTGLTGQAGLGVEFLATDMSSDGSIIVGRTPFEVSAPLIWDEMHGLRDLSYVLVADHGVDLAGWSLRSAEGISADGTVITGWGYNPSGQREAWIAVIPEPATLVFLLLGSLGVIRRTESPLYKA